MQVYASITFVLCFIGLVVSSSEPDDYKLEQLQVLFRHGDRTPVKSEIFPTDTHNKMYRSSGYGQLTKTGKEREYKIGQFLRERYDAFLGEYKSSDVYAYSSDFDLTKISLQLVLAGLYPPSPSTFWSDTVNWQPIPTHYNDLDMSFLSASNFCPQYKKLYQEIANTPEMEEKFQQYQDLFQRITNNTGITISTLFTARTVYFNLNSAVSMGLPLPDWCSEQDFRELEKVSAITVKAMTHTEQLRRMIAGPMLEQFLRVLNDNESPKKIYLYSASEYNIAAFVDAHNITEGPVTHDYGSALILEKLRGPDGRSYVRVYLWTGVSEKFVSLKVTNCERTCLLSDYEKIAQAILPNQLSRVCTSSSTLCRRRMESAEDVDLDLQLSYLFAGSDLSSFKYMKDFLPYTIESNLVIAALELENYKLEQLHVLFRHGDRTPSWSEIVATDPYDHIYQSYGYGQLTKTGKQREYKIGKLLRKRYDAFLDEYRDDDVYAHSSGSYRPKMSLQFVLASLYPPSPSTTWSDSVN